MFIVMGLYWLMEIISYHANSQNVFWVTVDFINTLQGVYIFIIFICNERALKILNKRFFPKREFWRQYGGTYSSRNRSNCSKISQTSVTEDMTSNSKGRTNAAHYLNTTSDKL